MKELLLNILAKNARLTNQQIASMLNTTPEQVAALIDEMEADGTIMGYKAIIDWDKTDKDVCIARIEVQVTPRAA